METLTEAEQLQSVQPMLIKMSRSFARQFNLDDEELYLEMQLPALKAVRCYNSTKRTLCSWVVLTVSRWFFKNIKHPGFRARYARKTAFKIDMPCNSFSLEKLLMEVSNDAAKAITFVLHEGVKDSIYIHTCFNILFQWSDQKIEAISQEIREALI